jgi:hypothetical protein
MWDVRVVADPCRQIPTKSASRRRSPARLITAAHSRVFGQPEALPGSDDILPHGRHITSEHAAISGALGTPGGEAEFPSTRAELEREKQCRVVGDTLNDAGLIDLAMALLLGMW